MLPSVNGQHHDFALADSKVDRIRESRHDRPTRLEMHTLVQQWIVSDSCDKGVEGLTELPAKTRTT